MVVIKNTPPKKSSGNYLGPYIRLYWALGFGVIVVGATLPEVLGG